MFRQPLGALIFFIAATAEANRTPFDLTEADSEIVAGFATEYSGMRFGFLFFAEYVNVFIISALMVTLYFGAWNAPFASRTSSSALDPGSLGNGLLARCSRSAPVVFTLFVRRAVLPRQQRAGRPGRRSLLGFITFNVVTIGLLFGITYLGLDWVAGLVVVPAQVVPVRVRVRVDARHAAPGPDRPADGLRLEVAAAGVAAQPVPDRGGDRRRRHPQGPA